MRSKNLSMFAFAAYVGLGLNTAILADEGQPTFAAILRAETKSTFAKVVEYLKSNPAAPDAPKAWQWLFVTALEQRLEADAAPLAEAYLKQPATDPVTRSLAQQALAIGLARSGQGDLAVDAYQSQLRFARLQTGGDLIDFGLRLATALRMARHFEESKQVLKETANKFFLDGEVRNMCENKIAKLALIDQPAPEINVSDTQGQPIDLSALQGKTVVVDFWATNCPPCLEELPNLKELHAQYRERGLEIIGVSLDGDPALVETFTQRFQVPWRMIVAEPDVEKLRERYLVRKIPSLYVVNAEGKIVQFDVKGADLRESIEASLNK